MLSMSIVGCSSSKKELTDNDVDKAMKDKYEIKNNVMTSTNRLLHVEIKFNDNNAASYSPVTGTLTYANPNIKDADAMIVLYNKIDEYAIIDKMDTTDVKIVEDFIATLNKNMTIKQFTTWCLEKGKDEAKKHEEKQANILDADTIVAKIEAKGYQVKKSTAGITIKDETIMIVIKNNVIGVYDSEYDFISSTGLLYIPQNDAASKQVNKEAIFIYQYASNSFIQGEGSLEEYSRIKDMKVEFDTFISTCGVTQEELATLK